MQKAKPNTHLRFWLITAGLFILSLYLLQNILLPFVAGAAIAYLLDPLCDRLEKRGMSRIWATVSVLGVFILVLVLVLLLVVPATVGQLIDLAQNLPQIFNNFKTSIEQWIALYSDRLDGEVLQAIQENLKQSAGKIGELTSQVFGSIVSGGMRIFDFLSLLLITPVVAFFLLRDWDLMVAKIDSCLPRKSQDTISKLAQEIDLRLSEYVRGVALVSLILGTFYATALSIVGLDYGLAIGIIAGALTFIPYVGAAVGFVLSTGLALFQFDSFLNIGIVMGIFLIGQAAEGNFLTPKLVGERIKLHPVAVIFALLAGGSLFGFTGVLLAVPVAAVVGVLVEYSLERYKASDFYKQSGEPAQTDPLALKVASEKAEKEAKKRSKSDKKKEAKAKE